MPSNINLKVRELIARHFGVDAHRVTDEARFRDDFGADWLDRLELIIAIEDQVSGFELADVVADHINTVGDLMRAIEDGKNRGLCGLRESDDARRRLQKNPGARFQIGGRQVVQRRDKDGLRGR